MTRPHRYYLFANATGAAWVRALFAQLGDGGTAEDLNCRTPLSPATDPTAAPVYWCCSFVATEAQRVALEQVETAGQVPAGVFWCRCDAGGESEGTVRASNHPWGQTRIGRVWDLGLTLQTLGLSFHRVAEVV